MSNLPQSICTAGRAQDLALGVDLASEVTAPSAPVGTTRLKQSDVAALARAFRAGTGSFDPVALRALAGVPIPSFYAHDKIDPIVHWLKGVIVRGGRVLLQGTRSGVGSSRLASDVGRVWNLFAEKHNIAERVVRLNVRGLETPKQFYRSLSKLVDRDITPGEYRMKSPKDLAEDFVADAVSMRRTTIIVDHLHEAPLEVRSALLNLLDYADPSDDVPTSTAGYSDWMPRLGFILPCNRDIDDVFKDDPRGLHMLSDGTVPMFPYSDPFVLAQAICRAGTAFASLDIRGNPEHEMVVSRLLAISSGVVAHIEPVLQVMLVIARHLDRPALSMDVLETAEEGHRELRERAFKRPDPAFPDQRGVISLPLPRESTPEDDASKRTYGVGSRKAQIEAREAERKEAEKENRKIQNRTAWVPEGL